MILDGIVFGGYIRRKIDVGVPEYMMLNESELESAEGKSTPSFGLTISTILVPLALILINTASRVMLPENGAAAQVLNIVGDPCVALTVAVLMAFYVLGARHGYSLGEVRGVATKALEPVGLIILVTGAGGVFGGVLLVQSGMDSALQGALPRSRW